jgi:N-acetylmuramoyl-L-alanine amidase
MTIVPPDFNALQGLRIIGYSIKNPSAAIKTFKRHFEMENNSDTLNEGDKKILYNLMEKYE